MRFDLRVIASWIEPGATVLDLGCGDGDLLAWLRDHKQVRGTGIELVEAKVSHGIERGLSVLQGDVNREILDYPAEKFDYAILSQTLQQVYEPADLIRQMLRVGRRGIVSFPNFGHWRIRLQLLLTGRAPVSRELPFQWHDTPNIRVITIKDFRRFAREVGFDILREVAINSHHHEERGHPVTVRPNSRATYGIFMIGGRHPDRGEPKG
ncbi:MAG: methionine biosynthesis protein MetW [Proteobacteria bacterium]|nr:methionine biosynthesis protein MetW [Pseudomonadota bacterium]